jgi:hypothetical protein
MGNITEKVYMNDITTEIQDFSRNIVSMKMTGLISYHKT